jgi:hypothetical protein
MIHLSNTMISRYIRFPKKQLNIFVIVVSFLVCVSSYSAPTRVLAETVSGNGYILQQIIAPIQGAISGNGFIIQQSSQSNGGRQTGGGYIVNGVFGTNPQATSSSSGGSGGGGTQSSGGSGGGYYVYTPPPTGPNIVTVTIASSTSVYPNVPITTSTCSSRVTFSGPIDFGASTNIKTDVVKLEKFLNTYEHENLLVNGIYEKKDVEAVKRWQLKYRTYVLDPMLLKNPTGTVYTLSQRQIERQTTKACGAPIVVTACPFFREYASYGDKGSTVKKIQQFLNVVRGEKLPLSGVYGPLTKAATKRFQQAYRKDIFSILHWSFISGNWNEATRIKANQAIGCDIVK